MTHKGTKKACILLAIKQIRLNHEQHKKTSSKKNDQIKDRKKVEKARKW